MERPGAKGVDISPSQVRIEFLMYSTSTFRDCNMNRKSFTDCLHPKRTTDQPRTQRKEDHTDWDFPCSSGAPDSECRRQSTISKRTMSLLGVVPTTDPRTLPPKDGKGI